MTDDNEKIEDWTKLSDLDKDGLFKHMSTTGKLNYDLNKSTSYFDKLQSFKNLALLAKNI